MKKLAIVTQSYKADFNECGLLCRSIDKFVPNDILHYIFVNDEDYRLFQKYNYAQHKIYKKSEILPKWLFRVPFKIAGHYFHISLITYPVREWIVQQICKLGAFEIIDSSIDCILNIDSETVFVRPFNYDLIVHENKYLMYKTLVNNQPSHDEYCIAAKKLLGIDLDINILSEYEYMNVPVCFERENTKKLLDTLARNNRLGSWKIALCNTYRFSEYYLYGIFVDKLLHMRSHYAFDNYLFPQIDISHYDTIALFQEKAKKLLDDKNILGLWLQKKSRKNLSTSYLEFNAIEKELELIWEQN